MTLFLSNRETKDLLQPMLSKYESNIRGLALLETSKNRVTGEKYLQARKRDLVFWKLIPIV